MKRFLHYNKKLKERAADMRKNMTVAEKKIWFEILKDLSIKSPSIPLDKGEETQDWGVKESEEGNKDWERKILPLTKGESKWNEQGDFKKIKVYRQRIIENYIVDFYLPEYKIVIEIDGDSHFTDGWKSYDEERTWILEWLWLKIIRFTNDEVMNNIEWVQEMILREL